VLVCGVFVDKISTPWGKYVPWYMIFGIPTAIFGWLTFTDFNLSPTGTLIYITITYIIYSILNTVGQAPYAAVNPAATKRTDDRVAIGQLSFFCALLASLFVTSGAPLLYKTLGGGNDAKGFSMLMAIIAIAAILISIFQVKSIKERYVINRTRDAHTYRIKDILKAVFTNKAAIIIYIYILASGLGNGIKSGIQIHFFKYYFHNQGLMAIMGVLMVPTVVGILISAPIIKRFGFKLTILTSTIVGIFSGPAIFFIPPNSTGVTVFIALGVLGALFGGISIPIITATMPAAMDYSEWKSGINVNAFMGSIQGFMHTFASAVAGAVAAGSLAFIGYVPGTEQSSDTILGLKILMGIIPTVPTVFGLCTACIAWFDITEEKQKQIARDLAERKKYAENTRLIEGD
jgi:sugar (glycoside-pentoside-hexuronide) transporter